MTDAPQSKARVNRTCGKVAHSGQARRVVARLHLWPRSSDVRNNTPKFSFVWIESIHVLLIGRKERPREHQKADNLTQCLPTCTCPLGRERSGCDLFLALG